MNTPSSALSDEMKGAMSTLLNAVIFEQWLRFSWIEEDEEGDFCIQIPAETVSELVEDYPWPFNCVGRFSRIIIMNILFD